MFQTATQTDVITFVQAVEKRPCLYDTNSPLYSDRDESLRAWKEISEIMGCTVNDCKDKWRNLRISFARSLKTPSTKAYYLAKYMRFLTPFLKTQDEVHKASVKRHNLREDYSVDSQNRTHFKTEQDLDSVSEEEFETEQEVFINYESTHKRRLSSLDSVSKRNRPDTPEDSRKMFLMSILPDVAGLDDDEWRLFRRQVSSNLVDIYNARQKD